MTRDYEALVIFKTAGTEQEIAQQASRLEEAIKKMGGRVENVQAMGRRRLAFRISRQSEGYYYALRFHAPTDQVAELERGMRLNDHIVRFIILTEEELAPLGEAAAAVAPAAAAGRVGAAGRS